MSAPAMLVPGPEAFPSNRYGVDVGHEQTSLGCGHNVSERCEPYAHRALLVCESQRLAQYLMHDGPPGCVGELAG